MFLAIGAAVLTLVLAAAIILGPAINSCPSSQIGNCVHERLAGTGLLGKPASGSGAPSAATPVTRSPAAATTFEWWRAWEKPVPLPAVATAEASRPRPLSPQPETSAAPRPASPAAAASPLHPPSVGASISPLASPTPTPSEPRFGLVQAAPSGELVIAGTAKPGQQVQIFANGALLGTTSAESGGDWVLVPEKPVAPGGVELTVGAAGSAERSPQAYVVAIDPSRSSAPTVVASKPGEMSKVLLGLNLPPSLPPTEAARPTPPAIAPVPLSITPTSSVAPLAVAKPTAADQTGAGNSAPAAEPVVEPGAMAPIAAGATSSAARTANAQNLLPADAAASVKSAAIEPTMPSAVGGRPLIGAAPATPSIDAIEIDGERDFFAGDGPEGAMVRLYVDDQMVGDARVAGGRWLVEAKGVLVHSRQLVRLDVLASGSAEVTARAEVNFVVDRAATAPSPAGTLSPQQAGNLRPIQSAEASAGTAGAPSTVAPADGQVGTTAERLHGPVGREEAGPKSDMALPRPSAGTGATNRRAVDAPSSGLSGPADNHFDRTPDAAAGVNQPGPALAAANQAGPGVAAANRRADAATAANVPLVPKPVLVMPRWRFTIAPPASARDWLPRAAPPSSVARLAPGTDLAPSPPTAGIGAIAPLSPPPNEVASTDPTSIPTLTGEPVGLPGSGRFASGKAIIRRGDNLWNIAERVYGTGLRYRSIYHANDDQIRNPRWIYPGQVFDLPKLPGR